MDYIQTEEIYRRLLKLCKEADTKNIHMLEFPVFLTLLSKVDVVMEDSDHEYFQNKFLLKNGKIVYEEAIKDLSIGVKLSKTNLMKESKRYLDQIGKIIEMITLVPYLPLALSYVNIKKEYF